MPSILPALATARLLLEPLAGGSLRAWKRGDRSALRERTGLVFPDPDGDPPMVGVDLPEIRERLAQGDETEWWIWLSATRATGVAVGSLAVPCDGAEDPGIRVAHWTYPQWGGRAFAREASDRLAGWMLGPPGSVTAPLRFAEGPGASDLAFEPDADEHDPRIGEVFVYGSRNRR